MQTWVVRKHPAAPATADVRALLSTAARHQQLSGPWALGVLLAGDAELSELNQRHRGRSRATDVLSFPARRWRSPPTPGELAPLAAASGPEMLGDLAVSLDHALAQASLYGHSVEEEVGFLLLHGWLHLLGHDHRRREAAARMDEAMAALLEAVWGRRPALLLAPAAAEPRLAARQLVRRQEI
jgi:probable rRNA maturation factor